jgi:hypothetical protein
MHVMVTVQAIGLSPVETNEVVTLSCKEVFERASEAGMKYDLRDRVPQQVLRYTLVMADKPGWNSRRRERRGEVEVEASVDPMIAGNYSGAFRVFHENHGAHRRDSAAQDAVQGAVGRFAIPAPVIGVHDKETGFAQLPAPTCWFGD